MLVRNSADNKLDKKRKCGYRVLRSAGNIQIYMKKYTIKYGNIPVTKQKVCCKITGTVQKTIIKKWNISDKIIVEVYRYMENELFEKAPVHKAYFNMALPLVFSMVISLVYNMVDTFFIARTGNTNLVAGVSL